MMPFTTRVVRTRGALSIASWRTNRLVSHINNGLTTNARSILTSTCAASSKPRNFLGPNPSQQSRLFSEAPLGSDAETQQRIKDVVSHNRIVLFMKGNPTFPQCGFSRMVAEVLKREGLVEGDYTFVDCLEFPNVREGIKIYGDWPTIPQLYVDGEFVGGCDIVVDMHKSGEMSELLKKKQS